MDEEKKFDPANFDFSNFDPSKLPKDFDPSKIDPSKMPPPPKMESPKELAQGTPDKNWLEQPDKNKWRFNGPSVMRGDMRDAMRYGAQAEKMKCDCWNTHCPFYGNCRKCIVFHKVLKQFPTCLRAQLTELYLADLMDVELHIQRDENGKPLPEPNWDEMFANGVRPGPGGYFSGKK